MKYFRISTKGVDNRLSYWVYAPTAAAALKVLDPLIGGINQNSLQILATDARPPGVAAPTDPGPQLLEQTDEGEE